MVLARAGVVRGVAMGALRIVLYDRLDKWAPEVIAEYPGDMEAEARDGLRAAKRKLIRNRRFAVKLEVEA